MTKTEFQTEIHTLASCFPKFRPESWKELYSAYYDNLAQFPVSALQWARQTIVQDERRLKDFPSSPELYRLCRQAIPSDYSPRLSGVTLPFHTLEAKVKFEEELKKRLPQHGI